VAGGQSLGPAVIEQSLGPADLILQQVPGGWCSAGVNVVAALPGCACAGHNTTQAMLFQSQADMRKATGRVDGLAACATPARLGWAAAALRGERHGRGGSCGSACPATPNGGAGKVAVWVQVGWPSCWWQQGASNAGWQQVAGCQVSGIVVAPASRRAGAAVVPVGAARVSDT
jgi:hypothetical protein